MDLTANMGNGLELVAGGFNAIRWGGDLAVDGSLENWTGNDPDSWDVTENGTGEITREASIVTTGNYSAKLNTPSGGGNTVKIKQDISGVIGKTYRLSLDVRCNAVSRVLDIHSFVSTDPVGTLVESYTFAAKDTWYSLDYEFEWGANDTAIVIATSSSGIFYVDNIRLETESDTLLLTASM